MRTPSELLASFNPRHLRKLAWIFSTAFLLLLLLSGIKVLQNIPVQKCGPNLLGCPQGLAVLAVLAAVVLLLSTGIRFLKLRLEKAPARLGPLRSVDVDRNFSLLRQQGASLKLFDDDVLSTNIFVLEGVWRKEIPRDLLLVVEHWGGPAVLVSFRGEQLLLENGHVLRLRDDAFTRNGFFHVVFRCEDTTAVGNTEQSRLLFHEIPLKTT